MSSNRGHVHPHLRALSASFDGLLKDAKTLGVSADWLATYILGCDPATVSKYRSPELPNLPPVETWPRIQEELNNWDLLRTFAEMHGFGIHRLEGADGDEGFISAALAQLAHAQGDLIEAWSDRVVTPEERERVYPQVCRALENLERLRLLFRPHGRTA
jgi:hypothetical protein